MTTLDTVISVASYFHGVIPYAHMVVTDREKYLHALAGEDFFLRSFDAGQPIREGSIACEVIATGAVVSRVGDPALTGGIPYQGTGVPLVEDGETVGALCVFFPTKTKEILQSTSDKMVAMVQQLGATSEVIKHNSVALSELTRQLSEESKEIEGSSDDIRAMAAMISDVSAETKILGLNAGIESARAGEAGRGFQVIAMEIRKLSQRTAESNQTVVEATQRVVHAIRSIDEKIKNIYAEIQQQADGVTGLTQSIDELTRVADSLAELAQNIRA
ncbi:methyl-accepting chemotaxis protein [Alicyclobacillus acidoterrestris]|uniref:Methyl-accepting chemotaxis protein n=1 Tax=Alicyclobacillus acidoterrestris (strain ATCC 49025 / DSM 3922 / CIP 106132 / NCIMB 13137 / GD3B) TaxID=1356854 RepID=T0BMG4_ALIAG|nr:methyl-accepting chemotaxis protein [Alicyclobacillus acidoterrestris]EPZ45198.1 hypothetical protein N007_09350 [Alicyclobacillus acidoterrestris ATCC 49025]UNO49911.1 methyl-accepting chemotaxis protein [Alicyclobacillus acidoterrestris]GEO26530.1 hypothetical protein AAC03nite_23150 [Alicyclobacillus acidoterrestris]